MTARSRLPAVLLALVGAAVIAALALGPLFDTRGSGRAGDAVAGGAAPAEIGSTSGAAAGPAGALSLIHI